jgi:hypothetical protein
LGGSSRQARQRRWGRRDINQYDHLLATVRAAFDDHDIDGDDAPDRWIPRRIAWMRGESDAAATPEITEAYGKNLKQLIDLIGATLRINDLPVVIGRIPRSWETVC